MDWLLAPIDPARAHEVGMAVSWHARSMVLAWCVLAPLGIIAARFFKIMPGQDWPKALDNQTWWRTHLVVQSGVIGLSICGLILVLPADLSSMSAHMWVGYAVLVGALAQVLLGLFRGSKGGPTDPASDGSLQGHHYDMTLWRRIFETLHKAVGYGTIGLGLVAVVLGLWAANAPIWMWILVGIWWSALVGLFVILQKRGMAIDTYQAIWGTDQMHPGNRRAPPGWGMRRHGTTARGTDDVRGHRGDRVRSH
jgi:hypothetical protein